MADLASPRVLILTPTGSDAEITHRVLTQASIPALVCRQMSEVCANVNESAGALLVAEEALDEQSRTQLFDSLEKQPTWSDLPIVVLTGEGELSSQLPREITDLTSRANITLLERPVRVATLMTTLTSALRARHRQLENRLAIEAIRMAREEADSANRAKSDFLATMSHELRTPLNAIAGYAEILALQIAGPLNEKQRQHVESISRSERHLLGLINDVLNFAKLEAGHVQFDVEAFDVTEVISSLEDFVKPQLIAKSLQYEVHAAEPLHVCADEDKVRQIMLNLLSNAIKFTAPGGRITVRVSAENGVAVIRVADSGNGIAPDKIETIFEPFVQVGRRFNSPSAGTGLGLAISRDLARAMKGDLSATSRITAGSTFILTLPLP